MGEGTPIPIAAETSRSHTDQRMTEANICSIHDQLDAGILQIAFFITITEITPFIVSHASVGQDKQQNDAENNKQTFPESCFSFKITDIEKEGDQWRLNHNYLPRAS